MQYRWERRFPFLELSTTQLADSLPGHLRGRTVQGAEPLTVGLRNTNYKVWLDGCADPLVIRFYVGDEAACRREPALANLVRKSIPIPDLIASDCHQNPPVAVFQFIDAPRLDEVLQQASPIEVEQACREAGRTLAAIHRNRFPETGWFDDQLRISEMLPTGPEGWASMLKHFLAGSAGQQLGGDLTRRLSSFVAKNRDRVPPEEQFCLVHADYKPWNLLVQNVGVWRVAAVLDWEFAFAGSPLYDLAIYLRDRAEYRPEYTSGFLAGYQAGGGQLPTDWEVLARLYDLVNLCSMLETPRDAATVADFHALIEATIANLS